MKKIQYLFYFIFFISWNLSMAQSDEYSDELSFDEFDTRFENDNSFEYPSEEQQQQEEYIDPLEENNEGWPSSEEDYSEDY